MKADDYLPVKLSVPLKKKLRSEAKVQDRSMASLARKYIKDGIARDRRERVKAK